MRVIDLLLLMHDYKKNVPVRVRCAGENVLIGELTLQTANDQPQLVIHPKTSGHPLKLWEVMALLDRPAYRQAYVYVAEPADLRPLFGFQTVAGGIVLN
ncbi:hypothetical protein [Lacticaseibacillus nasuensis]|uniref:hypothetical protein n=1 Tax=Lacticaseibacillus nasuensis TaxID=944671 RepID=UPI0006D0103C|nr:hypothetical protein [Lacticaseibacillus nasuensis]MCX2456105.1 hypothetical protein [Lacticaseibacillus nasuensis]